MIDIRSIINHILPQHCLLCGALSGTEALCDGCHAMLPWHRPGHCPQCALPGTGGLACGACLRQPPAFERTLALFDYGYPVDVVLQRYKYAGLLPVAELMGRLLAARLAGQPCPDLIIPMPLHPQRLRERGFNQAHEIAKVLARLLHLPCHPQACARTRHTPPQAGLSAAERKRNLKGAFACGISLPGRRVALVDDVMTTGASLDALARCVKAAGAVEVECWVVARTPRD